MTDNAIELLTKLVSIPSVSGKEQKAADFLCRWMAQNGAHAFLDAAGNAVGQFGQGPQEILLLGHIDTFPGRVPLRREGNLLYGRGSVDAKGPLCAFAAAAAQVEIPPTWTITVVGAVEEETAGSKGTRYLVEQRKEKNSPPLCCLIGEPSRWDRLTLGYKGRLLMDIGLCMALAHSSGPQPPPAEAAIEIWTAVQRHCLALNEKRKAGAHFDCISLSLRAIQTRDRGCYGEASLSLGFRLPEWAPPPFLKPILLECLRPWHPTLVGPGYFRKSNQWFSNHFSQDSEVRSEISFSGEEVCWKGGKSNVLVQAMLSAIRRQNVSPRFVVKTGTSDLNVIGSAFPQMPILAYGAGDSALDHTPKECLDLHEYLRSIEVLKETLKRIMLSSIEKSASKKHDFMV